MCIEAAVWMTAEELDPRARYAAALAAPQAAPGPRIAALLADVQRRFPDPAGLSDEAQDASPWVLPFRTGPEHLLLGLETERWREVLPWLKELAARHDLVLYNANFGDEWRPGNLEGLRLEAFLEADEAGARRVRRGLWAAGGLLLLGLLAVLLR